MCKATKVRAKNRTDSNSNTETSRRKTRISRRKFLGSTALAVGAVAFTNPLEALETLPPLSSVLGPLVGHTDTSSSMVWMRAVEAGNYTLEVKPAAGGAVTTFNATASPENDLCLHWRADGLKPGTSYHYRILAGDKPIAGSDRQVFKTAPVESQGSKVRFAISSCAREDKGSRSVWRRMAQENVDGVILIGDTPYIDSTEIAKQTKRHREFAAVSEYQELLESRPCWWTWDDHDFGSNDTTGLLPGKENSRLVYCRYRPQPSYGDGKGGIYTSFRYGPVEVFLLDTRWFSMTEDSYAKHGQPSMLGQGQWEWLQAGLKRSTAPFKILACGVIWDDKENHSKDHWGTYPYERKALENFIQSQRISGVILVGGDIHASRVLRYHSVASVGYNLVQFIASPIHNSLIPSLNVYNPDLVRSALEPHVFLLLEADSTVTPAHLTGTLINAAGERVFTYSLNLTDLTAV